jgi:hypothetical protein
MRSILAVTFFTLTLALPNAVSPANAADYSVRPGSKAARVNSDIERLSGKNDKCDRLCHRQGVAQLKCLCLCTGGIWHAGSHLCE